MNETPFYVLSLALLLAVAALCREVRIRRSLQRLLRRLLLYWRNVNEETHPPDAGRHPGQSGDRL